MAIIAKSNDAFSFLEPERIAHLWAWRPRPFFGLEHARVSLLRSFDQQQLKGWLQWTPDEGNDGHGHVQAHPREAEHQDGDVDIEQ